MALLRFMFICTSLSLFVNSEVIPENVANTFVSHKEEVAAVLDYINSSSKYVYRGIDLLNAQKKDDTLELLLNVNVDCNQNGQEVICDAKRLICDACVRKTPEQAVQVLRVNCTPVTTLLEAGNPSTNAPQAEINKAKIVNNEAVSSEVGDQFVAIRRDSVPCLGCPFGLNPKAEGEDELVNIALKHIDSERFNKQALVKTLKLQQQVDSSVKYILIIEVAPTVCNKDAIQSRESCPLDTAANTSVCQIKFIQKPWINRAKHVFSNNCTVSQEFIQLDDKKPELSNEVDGPIKLQTGGAPDFDHLAEGGGLADELSESRLEDLLSQIIVETDDPNQRIVNVGGVQESVLPSTIEANQRVANSQTPDCADVTEPRTDTPTTVYDNNSQEQTDAPSSEESTDFPRTKRDASSEESKESKSHEDVKSKSSSEEDQVNSTTQIPVTLDASRIKRAVRQLEKISPEEKNLVKNLADFAAAALDNIDDDNQKRVILQILGAKKMVGDDGVYYHLIMRMGVSYCLEETPPNETCREKLHENYTKICKVQVFVNDDFGTPKVVKSQCQNIKRDKNESNRTNYSRFRRGIPGGPSEADVNGEPIRQLANLGINHLNAQRKGNKYKPTEVISATSQVVAGILYRIKTKVSQTDCAFDDSKELEDCNLSETTSPDICEVKVWEKIWENFRQFTIKCDNDDKKYNIITTVSSKTKREVISADLELEKAKKYVTEILNDWDSRTLFDNKLKVLSINSDSELIEAGRKYNIATLIAVSDCKKTAATERQLCGILERGEVQTCYFEILEQSLLPNITTNCKFQMFEVKRDSQELFTDFIRKYNKRYNKIEYIRRRKIFRDNMNVIRYLNANEQGTAVYGVTKFADLTQSEFSKSRGLRPDLRNENETPFADAEIPDVELPIEFDWRTKNAVTEVKNQEQCGSCWAFSVTGNVEGQYALKHGNLLEFSEQELVDCDTEDQGCNGGLMDTAYRVIEKLGGLETENDYPYEAEDEKCHFNSSLTRVQLTGALNISQNETDMAKWLVANGPISIAINANAMQFYMGGVSHPYKFLCSPKNLDHGVLIVGYGVHNYPLFKKSLPYWIVKNSWGTSWGEQGYYRVYRGDGTCGLNQTPSSAIVA